MKYLIPIIAIALSTPLAARADIRTVTRLEIHPNDNRVLHAPADSQQLAVIAHFSDGSKRDVTRFTIFQSTDSDVATVNGQGRVTFHRTGEIAIICRYRIASSVKLAYVNNASKFVWPETPEANLIDHLVNKQLKRLQLPPSDLCEDHVFLRRAYLDLCGQLPTPAETRRFLDERHPLKRTRLIEELLDRPEHAEYWAFRWNEILGINWQLDKKNGGMVLHWFRDHVKQNTPLDCRRRS